MLKNILQLGLVLTLGGCASSKESNSSKTTDKALNELASLMDGKFSSEAQSKADTSYFHISLVMTPIWTDRSDGKWLYVEQAVASNLKKPYRQRVYHLQHPAKDIFTSDIYTIKDALSYAGLQNDNVKRDQLSFDRIELKDGCTVTLRKKGDVYEGGTNADKCPSDLRGAKYATTQILLKKGELDSLGSRL